MKRNRNVTHVLSVLLTIAITATIVAISIDIDNANLNFEPRFTIKPLPPWTNSPGGEPRNSTEPIAKWQSSSARLMTQFTNYMSKHLVDVNIRRFGYDKRSDSYDLEFDWQLPVTGEVGTDKIAMFRTGNDSKYMIDANRVAKSGSTIAVNIARQFTFTFPDE